MNLRSETLNLLTVLATPTEVFKELRESPRWKLAFVLVTISSMTIGWFMIPAIQEPLRKIYVRSFGAGAAESIVGSMMRSLMVIAMILETGIKLFRWVVLTSVLYFLSRYVTIKDDHLFKRLFTVAAYSEIVFIVMNLLNLLVIYARGLDRIENSADLTTVNKGLEIFFAADSNPPLMTLLSNINIFSLLYIVIFSIGVSVTTGLKRVGSIGFVSFAWLVWILLCMVQPFVERLVLEMTSS